MWPYFALLSLPCVLTLYHRQATKPLLAFTFLIFTLFIGLRYRVGMDWNNYDSIHYAIGGLPWSSLLFGQEPLSNLMMWLSVQLGTHMLLSNLIAAALLMGGVISLAARTKEPWISLLVAAPYLVIVFGMTGMRQSCAIGIILFMISRWDSYGTIKRVALVFTAALFHTSALFAMLLVVQGLRMRRRTKIAIACITGLPVAYIIATSIFFSQSISFYHETYLGDNAITSPGAIIHMGLVWLPAIIYLTLRKRLSPHIFHPPILYVGSVIAILTVPLFFISSTGGSRVILYLYFVPMMVYPALPSVFGIHGRNLLRTGLVCFNMAVLVVWLVYANNSIGHVPYESVLSSALDLTAPILEETE